MRRGWAAVAMACVLASACDDEGLPHGQTEAGGARPDGQSVYSACSYPGWSPDGTRIAFESRSIFPDAADDRQDIYTVGVDGTGVTSVAREPELGDDLKLGDWAFPNFPRWSPDGSKILFQASTFWTEDDPDTQSEEDWILGLYVVDISTRQIRPLKGEFMNGAAAFWSPDGSHVLFARATRTGPQRYQLDLWDLDIASGEERQLTSDGQGEAAFAYSPDGQRIVFNSMPEDIGPGHPNWDETVWIMNADGSGKRQLLDTDESERDGTWSPDGRSVAVTIGEYTQGRIAVVPADGGMPEEIVGAMPPLLLSAKNPAWSPDGTKIAFCGDGQARFGLYVANADGTDIRGVVPFDAAAGVGK